MKLRNHNQGNRIQLIKQIRPIKKTTLLLLSLSFLLACANDMVTIRKSNGEDVKVQVEIARTESQREKGLMFRQSLPEGHGMLFLFNTESANNFWMKNTPVSLDIIFSHYGKIVDIAPNTQPYSEKMIVPHALFTEVLEVPAGFSAKHDIKVGDQIVMN